MNRYIKRIISATWRKLLRILRIKTAPAQASNKPDDQITASHRAFRQALRASAQMERRSIEIACLVYARIISRDFHDEVSAALYRHHKREQQCQPH